MQTRSIPRTDLHVSKLAYGCMRLSSWSAEAPTDAERHAAIEVLGTALEEGINFFDHADIYARGKAETVFAGALRALGVSREDVVLQSKCGIRFPDDPVPGLPGRYDFSYGHITGAVEGILRRLGTGYLDLLLLHRPDPLVEPEEVARAFDALQREGKVRYFGVSNHTPAQIDLLLRYVDQPLVVNQLELSLLHHHLVSDGFLSNQNAAVYAGAAGMLDYCRRHDIVVQAWSPVAQGRLFDPPADAPEHERRAAAAVAALAEEKATTPEAVALAWILRHPARIQPIVGTMTPARLAASCRAEDVDLSREEWYALLAAARGAQVP